MEIIQYPSVIYVAPQIFRKKSMLSIMKNKARLYKIVKVKQVIVWFLYNEGLTRSAIIELTGVKRTMLYYSIDKVNDLISVNDKDILELINKINNAKASWPSLQ